MKSEQNQIPRIFLLWEKIMGDSEKEIKKEGERYKEYEK